MKLTGAEMVIEALKKEGVEIIFGIPGGAMIPVYDALYKSDLKHILTRHEQGAAHAADGYARATGKVGVCFATSGPGATNLVTGLATAYMDSVPVVAFTGQVPTTLIGTDAFQETDATGITMPITKYNFLVKDIKDLPRIIKEAFYIARSGRPGPVLIDLPKDIQNTQGEFYYPESISIEGYEPDPPVSKREVTKVIELLKEAKKPIVIAGGGIITSGASENLREFIRLTQAPIITTLMGLGSYPETDELSLGMLGMHGTRYANYAVSECDLLIGIGMRFDDRVTGKIEKFAPHAKIVHIDLDRAEIGKLVNTFLGIVGDAKRVLDILNDEIKTKNIAFDFSGWHETLRNWKSKHPLKYELGDDEGVKPQYIVEVVGKLTNHKAIVIGEVGQSQMWAAQFYKYTEPRTHLSSGGLGTMGYGLPAAIGAKLGRPDKIVVDISGDGSFQMNLQELATISYNKIPIVIALINNEYLGMVRQWQELFYDKRYSHTSLSGNPDFVKLAEAYGIPAKRVTKNEEVEATLKEAIESNTPYLIDFIVKKEENVFPMVPAGAALEEMIG